MILSFANLASEIYVCRFYVFVKSFLKNNIDPKLKSLYKPPSHKRKKAGTIAGRVNQFINRVGSYEMLSVPSSRKELNNYV